MDALVSWLIFVSQTNIYVHNKSSIKYISGTRKSPSFFGCNFRNVYVGIWKAKTLHSFIQMNTNWLWKLNSLSVCKSGNTLVEFLQLLLFHFYVVVAIPHIYTFTLYRMTEIMDENVLKTSRYTMFNGVISSESVTKMK